MSVDVSDTSHERVRQGRARTQSLETPADASVPQAAPASVPAPAPVSEPLLVRVGDLRDGDSPRLGGVDPEHVRVLAESDEPLPPIVVHRATMRVIDGTHRLHAARSQGRESIEVRYFDGTETEAFLLAVESNIRHGLPLSLADRRASAQRILRGRPEWSDRAIAARTGLSGKTVGVLRREGLGGGAEGAAQPQVRVGGDGRVRAVDPGAGRLRCRDVIAARGDGASLREIARAAGVSVETARDVKARLARGESPLPPGVAPAQERSRQQEQEQEQGREQEQARSRPRRSAHRLGTPVDLSTVLAQLKQDPAVRYSSDGRAVVRWLERHFVRAGAADIVRRAPSHQAPRIAAVARACAASWDAIAQDLEHLGTA
ncbi:ParB/RepB/Spo0J family partition protein [Streptomyces sp. NPDC058657]|uniref:ParB/RepB/Spo0J family partition protein n=1 Tax=unclassified Streptomyces TaxID=2593676 RepID=UPI003659DAE7